MFHDNNANRLRKEILIRVAEAVDKQEDPRALDRIPLEMRPRYMQDPGRCCVHKDRAVIKYRCMAALGFSVEDEIDELKSLGDYLEEARSRTATRGAGLTVIDEACTACVQTSYAVTNACRGCIARPCQSVCPKGAMDMDHGKARIDGDACINCGLCKKACPYHAIIRIPIPCEEACPVGAITKNPETGREQIDEATCISCGKCLRECPFAAIAQTSQMVDVLLRLRQGQPMNALVAPSIVGQFPGTLEQVMQALRELGFEGVYEVAGGAEDTARHEAAELAERLAEGAPFMTTSCCPAYVEAVRKHIPVMDKFVSQTPSPMAYTAQAARAERPGALNVFIGPCIAKRAEAERDPHVDFVLTFEELGAILVTSRIDVLDCTAPALSQPALREGRGFAVSGGVAAAIAALQGEEGVSMMQVDGLDRKSLRQLKTCASKSACEAQFVEVMCCEGGCLAGPGTTGNPRAAGKQLRDLKAQSEPIDIMAGGEPALALTTEEVFA